LLDLRDRDQAILATLAREGSMNLSKLTKELGQPMGSVYRSVERLETKDLLESWRRGRERLISLSPRRLSEVRASIGLLPSLRVLVVVSDVDLPVLKKAFKPDQVVMLVVYQEGSGEVPLKEAGRGLLVAKVPDGFEPCRRAVAGLLKEKMLGENCEVGVGLSSTSAGLLTMASLVAAREMGVPVLIAENGKVNMIT